MANFVELHPAPERLRQFGLGFLPDDAAAEIERHVAECPACCEALVAAPDDTLLSRLRRSQTSGGLCSATDAASSPPSELLNHPRYRLLEPIGRGGMGVVYRAEHRLMQRSVALKVIDPRLVQRPDAVERFRQEVRAASQLAHDNVVTAYDAEQVDGLTFLVTEFVAGETLDKMLNRDGPLPIPRACDYVRQAARGLQAAADRQLVHRDIKPANLIVTPEGRAKILDFGLARFVRDEAGAALAGTTTGTADTTGSVGLTCGVLLGTPDYMAPEQAVDSHHADIRADIYSLGCTLFHLLAGRPPFPDGDALDKLDAHRERSPSPLSMVRPEVPPPLSAVVERMMAKEPAARFSTPAEVAAALEPFAAGAKRRTWLRAGLLGLAAVALMTAVVAGLSLPGVRSDEFAGETLSSVWTALDTTTHEQVAVRGGRLVMEPRDGGLCWWEDRHGPWLYQEVRGDFLATARIAVSGRESPGTAPRIHFRSAGLLVRDPRSTNGNENWVLASLGSGDEARPLLAKATNTRGSASSLTLATTSACRGELRVGRRGTMIYVLTRLEGEPKWTLLEKFARPDFAATLQVGPESGSYFPHEPADLRAEFDYVHFAVPHSEADLFRDP